MLTSGRGWITARVQGLAWDALIALFFTGLAILDLLLPHGDDGYRGGPTWLNVPLVLLMSAPLLTRRLAPRGSYLVMVGAAVLPGLFTAHTVYFWASFLPIGVMVFTLARATEGWPSRWAWATGLLLAAALDIHLPASRGVGNWLFSGGLYAAAWAAGRTMRRFDLQGQALRRTLAALAEGQAAREEAAIENERARIAAEMHDVVAHAVSLMVVQVGATRMELERDGCTQPRLRTAEQAGRDALVELRRTLHVLRDQSSDDLHPLPGLASVPALVQGFRTAGLNVHLELDDLGPLPASAELAAYRILQQALSNALNHGGADSVRASVRRVDDELVLDVINPLRRGAVAARRSPDAAGGNGLAAMRERARMFCGSVGTVRSQDRFEVHAVLPLSGDRAAQPQPALLEAAP